MDNLNIKYVLLGVGGLVVLAVLGMFVMQRQNGASNGAASSASFSLPGSTPGRASGYKGAELMPGVPGTGAAGTAAGTAPVGHAAGYQNSNMMPAPTIAK